MTTFPFHWTYHPTQWGQGGFRLVYYLPSWRPQARYHLLRYNTRCTLGDRTKLKFVSISTLENYTGQNSTQNIGSMPPLLLKNDFPSFYGKTSVHWRHNHHGGVSNHQPHGCLLNRLLRRRSKKTSKLRVTGLCAGEFPAQKASNAENVSIWWRRHDNGFQTWDSIMPWLWLLPSYL